MKGQRLHRSALLLLLSLFMASAACSSRERLDTKQQGPGTGATKGKGAGTGVTIAPVPPPSQRELMQQMGTICQEIARRAGRFGVQGPAGALLKAVERMDLTRQPPAFATARTDLATKVRTLVSSTHPREDYIAVLDACARCHAQFAKASLGKLQMLRPVGPLRKK